MKNLKQEIITENDPWGDYDDDKGLHDLYPMLHFISDLLEKYHDGDQDKIKHDHLQIRKDIAGFIEQQIEKRSSSTSK